MILFQIHDKLLRSYEHEQNLRPELDKLCDLFSSHFNNSQQQELDEFYRLVNRHLNAKLNLSDPFNVQIDDEPSFFVSESLNQYAKRRIVNNHEIFETSLVTDFKRSYFINNLQCQHCLLHKCPSNCGCTHFKLNIESQNCIRLDTQHSENSNIFVVFVQQSGKVESTFAHALSDFTIIADNNWSKLCLSIFDHKYKIKTCTLENDLVYVQFVDDTIKYFKVYTVQLHDKDKNSQYACICRIKQATTLDQFPNLNQVFGTINHCICFQECPSNDHQSIAVSVSVSTYYHASDNDTQYSPKYPLHVPYYIFFKHSNYYSFINQLFAFLNEINVNRRDSIVYIRVNIDDKDLSHVENWTIFYKFKTHDTNPNNVWKYILSGNELMIVTRLQLEPYKVCYLVKHCCLSFYMCLV